MPTNWLMNKQNAAYPYNGILFGNFKKYKVLTHGWTSKTYAQWRKSLMKDYIFYGSIFAKYLTRVGMLVTQSCPTLCNPMDYSQPAPLSTGFSRQEYWSG